MMTWVSETMFQGHRWMDEWVGGWMNMWLDGWIDECAIKNIPKTSRNKFIVSLIFA